MIASTLSVIALAAGAAAAPLSTLSFLKTAVDSVQNTTQQAKAEWYAQNGNYGACGVLSKDSDLVAGLPLEFYPDLGAVSKYCGNYIVVQNNQDKSQVKTIRVEDASATNSTLSLSIASWRALNGDATGMQTVSWRFANATESAAAAAAEQSTTSSNGSSSSWSPMSNDTPAAPSSSADAPSSTAAAPSSTSSPAYTPKPSSSSKSTTPAWTPSSSSKAAQQTQQSSSNSYSSNNSGKSSGGGGQYSGEATWFTQNGNAGSCGNVNSDSSYVVAVPSSIMNSGLCGKSVSITNTATGQSISATIADTCPSCNGQGLDLSTGAFQALGSLGQGVLPISWSIN